MGVYGYADDISLLCPTVSGTTKMLKTCETFAKQHEILCNTSEIRNGQVIAYVDSCIFF